MMLKIS